MQPIALTGLLDAVFAICYYVKIRNMVTQTTAKRRLVSAPAMRRVYMNKKIFALLIVVLIAGLVIDRKSVV